MRLRYALTNQEKSIGMDNSEKEIHQFETKSLKLRAREDQSFALPVLVDPLHELHGRGRGLAYGPRDRRSRRHHLSYTYSFRFIDANVTQRARVWECVLLLGGAVCEG